MTSRNMKDTNEAECNLIAEEVNVNLHKLGMLMMNRIGRQVNCRDVVAVHDSCLGQRALKINKQLTKPSGLSAIALATAQYSSSALEQEVVAWHLEDQDTREETKKTQ